MFQDLAEISAKFQEEVSNFTSGTTMPTNPSASSHEEPTLEPESLEDRFHAIIQTNSCIFLHLQYKDFSKHTTHALVQHI